MASIVNPLASNSQSTPAPSGSSATASTGSETQVTEQQFLQLLVAQLQNQDPTSPMDSTQFVTQLAQFSELEQMIGVNQGVQQLVQDLSGLQPSTSGSTGAGTPPTGTGNGTSGTQPTP
ncbi:MAG TPA: flagellar hook capping FlgD N-terminal domain-containing protein [Bryobacteraceae bacterium]|nr:flagellar hook capping FlgD N-terminal domain-containing protein [Bryobacteraceae bacterium]